jgi:hypothetical protein
MTLNSLPPDPEPTSEELQPYLSDLHTVDEGIRRELATLRWRLEKSREDPDLFAIPFVIDVDQYAVYLRSKLWRCVRQRVLLNANYQCAGCSASATQVHHRDYRPRVLRGDDVSPLIALCARCHEIVEEARKRESWQAGERVLSALVNAKANATRDSN